MDAIVRFLTESRFGRLLSGIGNVYLLGAGLGAAGGAVLTYATPMLNAPVYLQLVAIGGAAVAGAAGLGLVRNALVGHDGALSATEKAELLELRTEVGATRRRQAYERLSGVIDRAAELRDAYLSSEIVARSDMKPASISDVDSFDGEVKDILRDAPANWAFYDEPPRNVVWSGLAWNEQTAAQFEYRRMRLTQLRDRYL